MTTPVPAPGVAPVAAAASPGLLAAALKHQREPWHAHLSALQRPAQQQPDQSESRPVAARRVLGHVAGVSLDPQLVMTPLLVQPDTAHLFLTALKDTRARVGAVHEDDGSGRQRWVLRQVPEAPGEYNIVVCGGGPRDAALWFLSAPREGKDVDLWHRDDASGRQRWVFQQVGDSQYTLRLAGGKGDDRVFLGMDKSNTVRLYDSDDTSRTKWRLRALDDAADPAAGPAAPKGTHVPRAVVPRLTALTGLSESTVDIVLQLISLPENGQPKWWTNYGYIEFLGDGRGFTATIFGACSGTGDLAMILDELAKVPDRSDACDELLKYADVLKKKRGDDIKGIEPIKKIIKGLNDDAAWQEAVWAVYVKLYWRFAMDWADKKGEAAKRPGPKLALAVSRGFMVDTAINSGAEYNSLMYIVKRMKNPDAKDEVAWVKDFAETRKKILKSGYQDLDTSKTGDRCDLWLDLLKTNPSLHVPFRAFKGYWGDYTIK